jgi:hypothetical protein
MYRLLWVFGVLCVVGLAVACAGGPGSPLDGYWSVDGGFTVTCSGTSTNSPLNGVLQFTDGITSGTVLEPSGPAGCPETFTVSGSVYTATNQSCSFQQTDSTGATVTATTTVSTDTITLTGNSYTETASGATGTAANTCQFTVSATAAKIGKAN